MTALSLTGSLQRQVGMIKSWKRYKCELADDKLTCTSETKSSRASLKREVIDLNGAQSVRKHNSQPLSFHVVLKSGKQYTFAADSHELVNKWISALQMAMQVRRRSLNRTQSQEERGTVYSEPWEHRESLLPILFEQRYRTDHASRSDYASIADSDLDSESGYVSIRRGNDYAVPDEPAHRDTMDSESPYADPVEMKRLPVPQSTGTGDVSPVVLRRSTMSVTSVTDYRPPPPPALPQAIVEATAKLSEGDVEKLLGELDDRPKLDVEPLVAADYSTAVLELIDVLEATDGGAYQLVDRRAEWKGTYIDKLRSLVEYDETTGRVQFQMDL